MHHFLAVNVSLAAGLNRGRPSNDSELPAGGWVFEGVVGGSVGGVGVFALLVGLVVALHRYWGAFEPLARALTNLVRAITRRINQANHSPPPAQPTE